MLVRVPPGGWNTECISLAMEEVTPTIIYVGLGPLTNVRYDTVYSRLFHGRWEEELTSHWNNIQCEFNSTLRCQSTQRPNNPLFIWGGVKNKTPRESVLSACWGTEELGWNE